MTSIDYKRAYKRQGPIPVEVPEVPPAVRAASDELVAVLEHERDAIVALKDAEGALRLAEHRDLVAEADALRTGVKAPKRATPGAQADLEAAQHTLELRQRIARDAQAALAGTVVEHRDAWLSAMNATASDRLERVNTLLAELEDALTSTASAGAAAATLQTFNGATAIDLRAVSEVQDLSGMLVARSSVLIEALATMAAKASGAQISTTAVAINDRARDRRHAQQRASKDANRLRRAA